MRKYLYGLLAVTLLAVPAAATVTTSGDTLTYASPRGDTERPADMMVAEIGRYTYSRKTADGQVKATAGYVHTISIAPLTATPTAGLLTIYDSATEANTVIYSEWVFATTVGHTIILDVPFTTALYVGYDGTLANATVTVTYR